MWPMSGWRTSSAKAASRTMSEPSRRATRAGQLRLTRPSCLSEWTTISSKLYPRPFFKKSLKARNGSATRGGPADGVAQDTHAFDLDLAHVSVPERPDAGGRPCGYKVARFERHRTRDVADEMRDGEGHRAGAAALSNLAVDACLDGEV